MLEIGRVCMKIAGRDAGKKGIVIDILDENYVLLDGEVRRRKCNIHHLEPMALSVELKKNASHAEVLKVLGIKEEKKKTTKKKKKATKKKEKAAAPRRMRMKKTYAEPKKEKKAAAKKTEAPKKVRAKKK